VESGRGTSTLGRIPSDLEPVRTHGTLSRAFTLLEVLLSVTIFLLLAGGIFAAVTVTMKASSEVALVRLESERLDALQRFLRHVFSNLPGETRLELRIRQWKSRGDVVELLFAPAPEFASFSQNANESGGLVLGAMPDGSGAFTFSLANYGAEGSADVRDKQLQDAAWTAMLPGVRKIRWRFAGSETTGLQETWLPANGRPGLADLEITLADGSAKHWQFLIPEIVSPAAPR